MRGEKATERPRGWRRRRPRGENIHPENETLPWPTNRSQPKLSFYSMTQTEVSKQPMHVQQSQEHTSSNKPQENHMYTLFLGFFCLFEQANFCIYRLKTQKKMETMKMKIGTYLAALLRKILPESKQGDAAYKLNKLDMLGVTLFSRYTLTARAFCTTILNSTLSYLFFSHCNITVSTLWGEGLHLLNS